MVVLFPHSLGSPFLVLCDHIPASVSFAFKELSIFDFLLSMLLGTKACVLMKPQKVWGYTTYCVLWQFPEHTYL